MNRHVDPLMRPAARLAQAAARTQWRALPADARAQTIDLVLDTFAIVAAASVHRAYGEWLDALEREPGACTIIGRGRTVSAANAALANGGAATVLQWQDGHRMARGHPACSLVPALLPLAETHEVSAESFMSAFVAGYEVGTRIGIALGGLKDDVHDAGTWSTIGTAAACARLLSGVTRTPAGAPRGSDAAEPAAIDVIARAIEGAAAVAMLPQRDTCWRGATMHHLYIGLGSVTALTAARAAHAGFAGIPGTLEGFFGPRAALDWHPEQLTAGIDARSGEWSQYELLQAYFKWHPTCAHFSGLADALLELQREFERTRGRRVSRNEIESLEIALFAVGLYYDAGVPPNDLAARFSARAIAYAAFDERSAPGARMIPDDALVAASAATPADRAWLERVRVGGDPELDRAYPAGRPARVRLKLRDGTHHERRVDHPYGDAGRPMTPADRAFKRELALRRAFGNDGAHRVEKAFARWLEGDSIAALSRALRSVDPR